MKRPAVCAAGRRARWPRRTGASSRSGSAGTAIRDGRGRASPTCSPTARTSPPAKAAISLGWVHSYPDSLGPQGRSQLELELKSLKLKGDRVVAPTGGPVRTKDAADCLMVLVEELLKDQLKRRPNRERLSNARIA